ncbi:hypothetical protein CN465_26305 [Bacillus cereus]|nr:hypothetical protein CN465_26305 [Bacillus cereus]
MQSFVNQKVNVVVPTHIANQPITFFQPEDRFLNTVVATTFLNPKSLLNIAVTHRMANLLTKDAVVSKIHDFIKRDYIPLCMATQLTHRARQTVKRP